MTQPILEAPTHFTSPRWVGINRDTYHGQQSPVTITYEYFNTLGFPISVCCRNGIRFVIPHKQSFGEQAFIVRVTISISKIAKDSALNFLSTVNESSSQELQLLKESFNNTETVFSTNYKPLDLTVDYPVTLQELEALGGSIYIYDADVFISDKNINDCQPHPYSEDGRKLGLAAAAPADLNSANFVFCIDLIDNEGVLGSRFMNINGEVYRIQSKRDSSRRSGAYLTTNRPSKGEHTTNDVIVQYYQYDEETLENIGLYGSYSAALTQGDLVSARKEEILRLEHESSLLKINYQRLKQEYETEVANRQKEQSLWEIERDKHKREIEDARAREEHLLAMQKLREKEKYEERSMQRKDDSEVLKYIPTVMVGIGALVIALKSVFGKSLGFI